MLNENNGILVLPLEQKHSLIRIYRHTKDIFEEENLASVAFAPLIDIPELSTNTADIPSIPMGVPPLLSLPTLVWHPGVHGSFPTPFKDAIKCLLLSAYSGGNICSRIPISLWNQIFTFSGRFARLILLLSLFKIVILLSSKLRLYLCCNI